MFFYVHVGGGGGTGAEKEKKKDYYAVLRSLIVHFFLWILIFDPFDFFFERSDFAFATSF